ncbi:hypothetical protein BGZ76_002424 [Entomortierella beljakovae]|nr:hypothetical protein BGZ76_002424 [Entomortierella beljakovae]
MTDLTEKQTRGKEELQKILVANTQTQADALLGAFRTQWEEATPLLHQRRVDSVVFILVNKAIPYYQQMCIRHSVQVGRMTPGRKKENARQLAMESINQKRLDDPEIVLLHSTSLDKVDWSKGVAG